MNRHANGSWGQLRIKVPEEEDYKKLLIFDDQADEGDPDAFKLPDEVKDYVTGMPYTDKDGWLPKKIFVANRHEDEMATFTYNYEAATYLRVYQGLLLTVSLMTIYFIA